MSSDISQVLQILVPLLLVGAPVAWWDSKLYYWEPRFLRRGIRLFHRSARMIRKIDEIPMPSACGRIVGWRAAAHRLGPQEVGVTVPVLWGVFHRGLLRVQLFSNSLELVAYLHGVRWLVPLTLIAVLKEPVFLAPVLSVAALTFVEERRRLEVVFKEAVRELRAA